MLLHYGLAAKPASTRRWPLTPTGGAVTAAAYCYVPRVLRSALGGKGATVRQARTVFDAGAFPRPIISIICGVTRPNIVS